MNQTKKRLSIIELAISITDIETIQLQTLQLDPLRFDTKIDEILTLLEDENYGLAQNLIKDYIDMPQETVIQRIQEEDISDEQAVFDAYDFLIDPTSKDLEDTEELPDNTDEDENEEQEDINEVKKIKDYLNNEVASKDYVVFYPAEDWTLMYWTKEYTKLLNSITKYDSIKIIEFNKKIKPQHDFLYMKIKNKSIDFLSVLESNIQYSKIRLNLNI